MILFVSLYSLLFLLWLGSRIQACSHAYHLKCLSEKKRPQGNTATWQCDLCVKNEIKKIAEAAEKFSSPNAASKKQTHQSDHVSAPEHTPIPSDKPTSFHQSNKREKERLKILKVSTEKKKKIAKFCEVNQEDDLKKMQDNPTLLNGHEDQEVHLDESFNGTIKAHQVNQFFGYLDIISSISFCSLGPFL